MSTLSGLARRIQTQIERSQHALRPRRSPIGALTRALRRGEDLATLVDSVRSGRSSSFFFDGQESADIVNHLAHAVPGWKELVLRDADRITAGFFRILGEDAIELGRLSLPWHEDFLSGYSWNPRAYYKQIDIPYNRADIKVPWELSRCQHLPTLGMAYLASGEERYAETLVAHVDHWIAANPLRYGVNWACAMDVAIRAVNWLWAFQFVREATPVSDEFVLRLLGSLLAHGRHLALNIERYGGGVTTNHTLGDYTGLLYLGLLLPELREAETWAALGFEGVAECMRTQVASDGVDFENSIAYHRFVLEMFVGSYILAGRNNLAFSFSFRLSLERMFEFVYRYSRPDGLAPLVGDSDDGRLQILSQYFDWEPQDHRYLLGVGGALLERDDFTAASLGAPGSAEETAWLLGVNPRGNGVSSGEWQPRSSRAFTSSGRYVFRQGDDFALVSADEVGTGGLGNHKHNDIFSFELVVGGVAMVTDPGSFSYTGDLIARDAFRSTRAHNTVTVDGAEQNEPTGPFGMRTDARVRVLSWRSEPRLDHLDAVHTGYERLAEPVTHRRRIWFGKSEFAWLVVDTLTGRGQHEIETGLHLAKGAYEIEIEDRRELALRASAAIGCMTEAQTPIVNVDSALGFRRSGIGIVVVPLGNVVVSVETAWLAPRYGQRVLAPAVYLRGYLGCPASTGYLILKV